MRLNAYCDLSFLDNATRNSSVDFLDPISLANARHQYDMADLLNEGLLIRTNATPAQINDRTDKSSSAYNPCILHLAKNNRLIAGDKTIDAVVSSNGNFFKTCNHPFDIYFIAQFHKGMKQLWQDQSGCHFMTSSCNQAHLFAEQVKNFQKDANDTWSFAKELLQPHHSLIIADPYLYKDAAIESLAKMLKAICPSGIKSTYTVTLLGCAKRGFHDRKESDVRKEIEKTIRPALEKINLDARLEAFFYDEKDFHDRYVISNNACIFSGYGIDTISKNNVTKVDTTWIAFSPYRKVNVTGNQVVFFSQIMKEKLQVIGKWIDIGQSKNPLLAI